MSTDEPWQPPTSPLPALALDFVCALRVCRLHCLGRWSHCVTAAGSRSRGVVRSGLHLRLPLSLGLPFPLPILYRVYPISRTCPPCAPEVGSTAGSGQRVAAVNGRPTGQRSLCRRDAGRRRGRGGRALPCRIYLLSSRGTAVTMYADQLHVHLPLLGVVWRFVPPCDEYPVRSSGHMPRFQFPSLGMGTTCNVPKNDNDTASCPCDSLLSPR
jgi:hypothetical protein